MCSYGNRKRVRLCGIVRILSGLLLLVLLGSHQVKIAHGIEFYGSDPLGSAGVVVGSGIDLLNTDEFNIYHVFANPGTGDFANIPYFTSVGPDIWTVDLGDLSSLTLGSQGFGIFTASSSQVLSRDEHFVDVYLDGVFDSNVGVGGTPFLTSATGEIANLRFSMTQTGQSISWSGTLMVNGDAPLLVPEPTAGVVALLGVFGFFVWYRRRRFRGQ
ncbi:MAG: hypothetical protein ABGX16_25470 [Pirellulales bacterium]